MKALLEQQDATYLVFQPGDGTMYRAFLAEVNEDQVYVAIGSNPYIKGGYILNISSLEDMLREMYKYASTGRIHNFVIDYPFFGYIHGHLQLNPWTEIAALITAAIYCFGNVDDDWSFSLHRYVYLRDNDAIVSTLEDFSKEYGFTLIP